MQCFFSFLLNQVLFNYSRVHWVSEKCWNYMMPLPPNLSLSYWIVYVIFTGFVISPIIPLSFVFHQFGQTYYYSFHCNFPVLSICNHMLFLNTWYYICHIKKVITFDIVKLLSMYVSMEFHAKWVLWTLIYYLHFICDC